jgi:murein L,D-transpeptidase YcbB/YkuD
VKVLRHSDSEPRTRIAVFHRRQRKPSGDHAIGEAILTRGLLARGAFILAAVYALAAPAALAAEPGGAFAPTPSAAAASYTNADLGQLLNNTPELVIAGERLNTALLRRFYARHGFAPIWTTRQAQAMSLINAVLRSGNQGLAPELFHANLLLSSGEMAPLDRELLLSDAFLNYADALARGIMPVERRPDDQVLTPEPLDVAGALDAIIASPDPAAAIEKLAPTTPTYMALRQALLNLQAGAPANGKITTTRLRQIEVNLERERWMPRHLPADRVWVNVADERVVLYRNDQPVYSSKVIVGQDVRVNQSPEFQAMITGVIFNPPWNIPTDIANNEILPKVNQDPNYLTKHNMIMLPDGVVQQVAGPNSGLGQMMLDMRNRFDVYLHDTPGKNVFARDDRRVSHGCIRVEKPRELAALLMQQPDEAIDQAIAKGDTTESALPQPVPVYVTYETAFADADGKLQFRPDFYGRDTEIWQYLDPERRAVAERDPPGQRGG